MKPQTKAALACCAPFAVWTALLTFLPATAAAYAVRTAATAAAGLAGLYACRDLLPRRGALLPRAGDLLLGVLAGLFVFAFWVAPEGFEPYRLWCVTPLGRLPEETVPAPYAPETCGWALTAVKLAGSAFVIAPAEEVFFRFFLYRWIQAGRGGWLAAPARLDPGAFAWTVGLFACEHDRFAVAALCGVVYGLLAVRRSLACAIAAHVTTNLVLAVYVIACGKWGFW